MLVIRIRNGQSVDVVSGGTQIWFIDCLMLDKKKKIHHQKDHSDIGKMSRLNW